MAAVAQPPVIALAWMEEFYWIARLLLEILPCNETDVSVPCRACSGFLECSSDSSG